MVNKNPPIELDSSPIKVRQKQDKRNNVALPGTPPAHVTDLLQSAGFHYDPKEFSEMTIEQHSDEAFKLMQLSKVAKAVEGSRK